MLAQVNWTIAGVGLLVLLMSILSVFRPNLVWGNPAPLRLPQGKLQRLHRRRQIGTVVLFIAGAALLILSTR